VVTDVTGTHIYAKGSGGNDAKGANKNSQKSIDGIMKKAIQECEQMGITHLKVGLNGQRFNRTHRGTTKYALKLVQGFKTPIEISSGIANDTPHAISTIRLKGGARGRRV
jgi:ribosomal protein S11